MSLHVLAVRRLVSLLWRAGATRSAGRPHCAPGDPGLLVPDASSTAGAPPDATAPKATAADGAAPALREHLVPVEAWSGTWADDDPNANFKADVALHSLLDPMATMRGLAAAVGLPAGAVVHYALARYATSGSAGLLELGPKMVERLWAPVDKAERSGDDASRLHAYHEVRKLLSWLRAPLTEGATNAGGDEGAKAGEV